MDFLRNMRLSVKMSAPISIMVLVSAMLI